MDELLEALLGPLIEFLLELTVGLLLFPSSGGRFERLGGSREESACGSSFHFSVWWARRSDGPVF